MADDPVIRISIPITAEQAQAFEERGPWGMFESVKLPIEEYSTDACEFCDVDDGTILTQDMGDGRRMRLCARCRSHIEAGLAGEREALE